MKAVVAAFNQEKALVGAFSAITNLRMELFEALVPSQRVGRTWHTQPGARGRSAPQAPHSAAVVGLSSVHWAQDQSDTILATCSLLLLWSCAV